VSKPLIQPILTTKLFIPPIYTDRVIKRESLCRILNDGVKGKLTLISAPAGFGKTTLVSMWTAQATMPVAWLSLDREDNDINRFLAYIIAALQSIVPEIGMEALSLLRTPQSPDSDRILTNLLNDLADSENSIVLILDDYHLIEARAVHDAVTFFIDHAPSNTHLMILTRADPTLPIPRLRGRGQLTELRAADLCFNIAEAIRYLDNIAHLPLSTDDANALHIRTEGWIAALQMVAISMRGRKDLHGFVTSFTGSQEYIADYLTDEVLELQPERIRTFLLQTSILDRMTGPLCDVVLERRDSQSTLEKLQEKNLFLVSLDDKRCWYRYHHLFGELLRQRLKQESPDWIAGLHQRASLWFEGQGLLPEAIKHTLDAQDFDRAALLINQLFDRLWETGEHITLKNWLRQLPDETFSAWPQLIIRQAMFHIFSGQIDLAKSCLHEAEKKLQKKPLKDTDKWQGVIFSLRSHFAWMQGDIAGIVEQAQAALAILPKDEYEWRSFAAMTLGTAWGLNGNTTEAETAYAQALEIAKKSGNLRFILGPVLRLTYNLKSQGKLVQTMDLCEQSIQQIKDSGQLHHSYRGALYSLSGDILREWNRLDDALEHTQKGLTLGKQGLEVDTLSWNYYLLLRVLISRQDIAHATKILQGLEQVFRAHDMPKGLDGRIAEVKIQLFLAQYDLISVDRYLKTRDSFENSHSSFTRVGEFIQWARFYLIQGCQNGDQQLLNEALALLARLEQLTEKTQIIDSLIRVLALKAIAYQAIDEHRQAADALGSALILGEQDGYIRTFVDEGPAMRKLLSQLDVSEISADYLSKIKLAFISPDLSGLSVPDLKDPLSDRELQVLQYLKTHLTTTEIADELYLSVHTVRSHVKSIYSKLQVNSRTQAVERAQTLGID
jgi:LuxR family maltose regulon positive regulatory protein